MTIKVNDAIPSVDLKISVNGELQDTNTKTLFATGKSILVGVPGAFTPTCSQAHLPGYVVQADVIKAKGVERIVCMSVNDAFVMQAWGKSSNAEAIGMLADGNAAFTKALGLELDASGFGMGTRCQRFAMIIENGKVSALFVEPAGAFEVSTAEYVLKQL